MNIYVHEDYVTLFDLIRGIDFVKGNSAPGKIYKAFRKGVFEDADSPGGSILIFQFQDFMKEFHPNVYRVMYVTPFEDIPLNINDDEVSVIVKWRFKIGK